MRDKEKIQIPKELIFIESEKSNIRLIENPVYRKDKKENLEKNKI